MEHAEHRLLVDSRIARLEAEHVLAGPDAALVRVLQREREQVLEAEVIIIIIIIIISIIIITIMTIIIIILIAPSQAFCPKLNAS